MADKKALETTDEKALAAEAERELERGYEKAEQLLEDKDSFGNFLREVEEKSKHIPLLGDLFAKVTLLIEMIKQYSEGSYRNMPIATAIAIVSALAYFISPIDLITDALPVIGHLDDAAVVGACFTLINGDIEKYERWRAKKEAKEKEGK